MTQITSGRALAVMWALLGFTAGGQAARLVPGVMVPAQVVAILAANAIGGWWIVRALRRRG